MKVRREIEKEQEHESEAHALLTAGSGGLAEVVERVNNNNFAVAWATSLLSIRHARDSERD